jgi:hypothetical protein
MTNEFESTLEALESASTGLAALDGLMGGYVAVTGKAGGEATRSASPKFTQNLDDAMLAVPAGILYRLDGRMGYWRVSITDRCGKIFKGWHANACLATCIASVRALNATRSFPDAESGGVKSGEFEESGALI